jgi:Cu-Zn family superoxide dismutase
MPVNPFNKEHGAPDAAIRHVGDLGNVKTDGQGNAKGTITDKLIKLIGPESVVGRTIVCHSGSTFTSSLATETVLTTAIADDLGLSDHPESKKTGNAGLRPACGVIGIAA